MSPIPPPLSNVKPFPPEGWTEHPDAPGQYYKDGEVLHEIDLRLREDYPTDPSNPMAALITNATGVRQELPSSGTFDLVAPLEEPKGPEEEKRAEIPIAPEWSEKLTANTAQTMDIWSRKSRVGDVSVTMEERMLYFKQAWHNAEICLDIVMGPAEDNHTLAIRTMSNRTLTALYEAVELDRKAGEFGEPDAKGFFDAAFMATRIQHYSLMLQLASTPIEGEVLYADAQELAKLPRQEIVDTLREKVKEWGERLSAPRHAMLVTAVTIFEEKVRLCKEALANGDFSEPAS